MIPKTERVMTTLCKNGIEIGVITVNQMGTAYYLYETTNGDYRKMGKSDSPLELEQRYKMYDRMGVK